MNAAKRIFFGRYVRPALLVTDWLWVNMLFALVLTLAESVRYIPTPRWELFLLVNLSFIPMAVYESRSAAFSLRAIRIERTLRATLCTVGLHALFFMALLSLLYLPSMGWKFYVFYYGLMTVVLSLWAVISRHVIKYYRRRGYNFLRVVIVGANSTGERLLEAMGTDPGYGYKVLGFFDRYRHPDFNGHYCGQIDELDRYVRDNSVDQIFFAMPGNDECLTQVVKVADDNVVDFFYVPQISRFVNRDFQVDNIGSVPVLTIRRNPLKKTINSVLKRTTDVVLSSIFLLFYPLVYIPVAIAIKMSSPGPVYFRQERTGYRGKPFTCLKFRTMHVNPNADIEQATANDPRKTRLGEFLRHTSIDELPQFINVLRGDMSIVGPRPHMLRHTDEYSRLVDKYMVRHFVRPGITGWAQVNGYRGPTDELWKMEKRVECDVWYIEHWSWLLDLKIIGRTVFNAFAGETNAL